MPATDLTRFVDAQQRDFESALLEIESSRKRTHWMWYVFPQVSGLGMSATSQQFAIRNMDEAAAFLTDPVLGDNYRRVVDAVWHQVVGRGVTIVSLFGRPDDAKLVSSLTLFSGVAKRVVPSNATMEAFISRAEEILEAGFAQGLGRCTTTEQFLSG